MDIGDTYYHPSLLLLPGLPLACIGLFVFLDTDQSAALPGVLLILEGVLCLLLLVDIFRVRRYVAERGSKLASIAWAPFGPGWFSFTRRNSVIYKIEYAGPMGQEIVEHVRVSLWFGVEPTD